MHLDFVIPSLRKQWTDGPVDEARGKNFLLGWAAFAFEVAARELTRRGGFLAVIHREREKILAFLCFGRADGGYDDNSFAQLDRDGSIGLFSEFSGFDNDLLVP